MTTEAKSPCSFMLRQAQHERSATPAWAVPVLERSIDPEFVTYDLHLLRATIQLVRSIMERSGPGELVIWVDDEDQVPDWARRALERFLMTGQESNSAMDSGDRGGCSHNQYHVRRV